MVSWGEGRWIEGEKGVRGGGGGGPDPRSSLYQ